jgi:endonuclease/exonuclease/phosphatase family metal-dependent hydrolase
LKKIPEYQKWCFDTIVPIVEENKALKRDVVCLQEALQQARNERNALQASIDEQRHHLDQEKKGI